MSIHHETYIIYGIKLDPNKVSAHWEELDDKKLFFNTWGDSPKGTYGVLYDGMSGEYCIAGKCLAINSDENGDDFDVFPIPLQSVQESYKLSEWIRSHELQRFFNTPWEYQNYAVSHWH